NLEALQKKLEELELNQ
nr:Chain D, Dual specificity mitogen-activated protein kinase kinase 1 [Homo sapiens]